MTEIEALWAIFQQQGGGLFFVIIAVCGVVYACFMGVRWVSVHALSGFKRLNSARDEAFRELLETLKQQHAECRVRVEELEARVRQLEERGILMEQHNAALNGMVIDLRKHLFGAEGASA